MQSLRKPNAPGKGAQIKVKTALVFTSQTQNWHFLDKNKYLITHSSTTFMDCTNCAKGTIHCIYTCMHMLNTSLLSLYFLEKQVK